MVVVVRINQSQSNMRKIFDCDWSVLITTISYNYAYAIVEWAVPNLQSTKREQLLLCQSRSNAYKDLRILSLIQGREITYM